MIRAVTTTAALLLGMSAAAAASGVRHDPFARPQFEAAPAQAVAPTARRVRPTLAGTLRATVVAGDESMANVDGLIMKLGDELGAFRLVEIREREAIFDYQG